MFLNNRIGGRFFFWFFFLLNTLYSKYVYLLLRTDFVATYALVLTKWYRTTTYGNTCTCTRRVKVGEFVCKRDRLHRTRSSGRAKNAKSCSVSFTRCTDGALAADARYVVGPRPNRASTSGHTKKTATGRPTRADHACRAAPEEVIPSRRHNNPVALGPLPVDGCCCVVT